MKNEITVKIPEWAEGRRIYVYAGISLLAYKHPDGDKVYRKTGLCNQCGDCCRNIKGSWIYPVVDGTCIHLDQNNLCDLGVNRPFACGWPTWQKDIPHCTETFDNEDDPHKLK